jgi:hypothetical protein
MDRKHIAEHRGFRLWAWKQGPRGGWYGMAKGLGTVVLPSLQRSSDGILSDLRRRIDLHYERGLGVFRKA